MRSGVLPIMLWAATAAAAQEVPAARQAALVHLVRNDCGACHGLRLTGGLGPALTREALAGKPPAALATTILHGRPGTPMPGWRSMLTEAEAHWIAERLSAGLDEPVAARWTQR